MTRKGDGVKLDTMKNVQQIIGEIIRKRGPIRKVAEEIGIDHGNLIRILREGSDPRIKTIERIVNRLGYSLNLKRKEVTKDTQGLSKPRR